MKIDRLASPKALFAAAPPAAPPDRATSEPAIATTGVQQHQPSGPRKARFWLTHGLPLLIAAILLLGAFWPRAGFALDIGRPGDQLFLGNVHGDERVAEYSYRWTNKNTNPTTLIVPGWGAISRAEVTVRAQTLPQVGGRELRLIVNGQEVGTLPIGGAMATTTTTIAIPPGGSGDLILALAVPTSRVPGDNRDLGIKLDTITLTPLASDAGAYWRTVWPHWFGALAVVGALLLLTGRSTGRLATVGRYSAGLLVPLVFTAALPWALALLPAAFWASAAALALRWHARVLAGLTALWSALDRPRVAGWVAVGGIALYVAIVLPHLLRVPWINHADYADNAVVARNLVQGRGFTVDYIAQFYRDWPTVRHPAETWPPLQPLMIAIAFTLFGVSTGVAKLPNLLVMIGLLALVFQVGRSLWSPRVGLLAALFVALSPDLFDGVVYPLNDTAFALLCFGCFVVLVLAIESVVKDEVRRTKYEVGSAVGGRQSAVDTPQGEEHAAATTPSVRPSSFVLRPLPLHWLLLGTLGGLLLLCKPSGAVLLAGGGAWALWRGWRTGRLRPIMLGGLLAAGVAALVFLPWAIRNWATFGVPFYSTESHDAWLLEYRDWETIYKVYAGRGDLPHPRLLVGYGFDAVSTKIVQQFRDIWRDLQNGEIVPLLLLAPAIIGAIVARGRQRALLKALGVSVAIYAVFIATYWHYEQRYTLFLIPWGALLGAAGLWWLHDHLAAARSRAVAGVAVLLAVALIIAPQWEQLQGNWRADLRISNPLVVAWWVRDNTPPGAIVMTRNPWELSFHSERQSVMIPFDDLATIKAIGQKYGVTYLQLDHLTERATRRPDLAPLYDGAEEWSGFRKVFDRRDSNGEGLLVYTFPQAGR